MSCRKTTLLSIIALAGGMSLLSASAEAQYLPRPYYRSTVAQPYYYRNAYNQAYIGGGVNVLPPTIVGGFYDDPFGGMLPSVYGCCRTTHNEAVGLVGSGGGGLGR